MLDVRRYTPKVVVGRMNRLMVVACGDVLNTDSASRVSGTLDKLHEVFKFEKDYQRVIDVLSTYTCYYISSVIEGVSLVLPNAKFVLSSDVAIDSPVLESIDIRRTYGYESNTIPNAQSKGTLKTLHLQTSKTQKSMTTVPEYSSLSRLSVSSAVVRIAGDYPKLESVIILDSVLELGDTHTPALKKLQIDNCESTSGTWKGVQVSRILDTGLVYLNISKTNVDIKEIPTLNKLKSLDISETSVRKINDMPELVSLKTSNSSVVSITSKMPNLRVLVANECGLGEIGVYPRLKILECSGNEMMSIPGMRSLVRLDCSMNLLTQLPVECKNLEFLNCSYNIIQVIPRYQKLVDLICKHNKLVALPSPLKELETLDCSYNRALDALPEDYSNLLNLTISSTKIVSIPESLSKGIEELDLTQSSLETLDYCKFENLKRLDISWSSVKLIPNPDIVSRLHDFTFDNAQYSDNKGLQY